MTAATGSHRRRSGWAAVAIGLAVDIVGTAVASSILFSIVAMALGADAASVEKVQTIANAPLMQALGIAIGASFTGLGAYVAARLAGREEMFFAITVAVLSIAFGEWLISTVEEPVALGIRLASYIAGVGAAYFAGTLCARRRSAASLEEA